MSAEYRNIIRVMAAKLNTAKIKRGVKSSHETPETIAGIIYKSAHLEKLGITAPAENDSTQTKLKELIYKLAKNSTCFKKAIQNIKESKGEYIKCSDIATVYEGIADDLRRNHVLQVRINSDTNKRRLTDLACLSTPRRDPAKLYSIFQPKQPLDDTTLETTATQGSSRLPFETAQASSGRTALC